MAVPCAIAPDWGVQHSIFGPEGIWYGNMMSMFASSTFRVPDAHTIVVVLLHAASAQHVLDQFLLVQLFSLSAAGWS